MTELSFDGFKSARRAFSGRGQSKGIEIREHEDGCCHLVKIYKDEALTRAKPELLRKIVNWRRSMPVNDRGELDCIASVPRHIVLNANRVVGVAIPIAPQRFWYRSKSDENRPRDASKLCVKFDSKHRREYFSEPFRYAFLGHFLKALLWLHDHNAVLGDVSLQNVLVGDDGSCFLLDMDSAWLDCKSAFGAIENERFAVAFDHTGFTSRTDLGKFAIVATKVLGQDSSLKNPMAVAVKDKMTPRHHALLIRMWEGKPVDSQVVRRMADDWIRCSRRNFGQTFRRKSIAPVPYTDDASVFLRASGVTSDICVSHRVSSSSGSTSKPSPVRSSTRTTSTPHRVSSSSGSTSKPSPVRSSTRKSDKDYSWVWWLVGLAIAVFVSYVIQN